MWKVNNDILHTTCDATSCMVDCKYLPGTNKELY